MTIDPVNPVNLKGRSFVKELDFTPQELTYLLDLSKQLKADKKASREEQRLRGKTSRSSSRKTLPAPVAHSRWLPTTRARTQRILAQPVRKLAHKETIKDTARVLGRMYDAIEYRGFGQDIVETLVKYCRRAGLQRPHQRISSDANPGRPAYDDRALPEVHGRNCVLLLGRRALQHGQFVVAGRRAVGHGCAHLCAQVVVAE